MTRTAVEETGFGDVGDAAVDDHRGVQDFVGLGGDLVSAEQADGAQIQRIAFLRADDQADVAEPHHQAQLEKMQGSGVIGIDVRQHDRHQESAANAGGCSQCRSDQPGQADSLEAHFDKNDRQRNQCAARRRNRSRGA